MCVCESESGSFVRPRVSHLVIVIFVYYAYILS